MQNEVRIIAGEKPPHDFASVDQAILRLKPDMPVHFLRPQLIYRQVQSFLKGFPGEVGYAVRANFENLVLAHMYAGGISWFSCDTLEEIETVSRLLPDARFIFSHPIKTEQAIAHAYQKHRVRAFVLDHPDELARLRAHTGPDTTLLVRLIGPPGALLGEGYRFGCDVEHGVWLARAVVEAGYKLGLCFSLGSQVMDPTMYDEAFLIMREVMYRARFMLDMVAVGGGFPAVYDGLNPPPLAEYFNVINKGLARLHLPRTCRVLATPGRALVNDAISILTRVEQRRGQMLYINDGLMGGLGSINVPWWRPAVRLIRPNGRAARELDRYTLSGPAVYGNDTMPGPFYLPDDAEPGDYLEFGQLGAYSGCMTTAFHCLPWPDLYTVDDDPPLPSAPHELPDDIDEPVIEPGEDDEPPLERGLSVEEPNYDDEDFDDVEDYDDPTRMPRRR